MKYYAVRKGRNIGVYTTWDECKEQVNGYSGAEYKSFKTKEEAEAFVGSFKPTIKSNDKNNEVSKASKNSFETKKTIVMDIPIDKRTKCFTAYVDGSNDGDKTYGYGVVGIDHDIVLYEAFGKGDDDEMRMMRNVAGEILGAMEAVKYACRCGYEKIDIYYDYKGIEMWVTGGYKAKNKFTQFYKDFMRNQNIDIYFHKVAAHTGVEFNERADELAKMAVEK